MTKGRGARDCSRHSDQPGSREWIWSCAGADVHAARFLPIQCAYADFFTIDTFWPDMRPSEVLEALSWYDRQDIRLGG